MNMSDLLKIYSGGFAELVREQMKQNGKPISTCGARYLHWDRDGIKEKKRGEGINYLVKSKDH